MVSELMNFFDIISFKPDMKINGNSRYITNLGKGVSIMCLFSIIILSGFIILDVLTRKTYTIITSLDSREIPNIKINQSQIAMVLIDATGNEFNEYNRYFNFMVKFWKIEIPNNYQQNTSDYKQTFLPKNTIINLPLKNCSSLNYTKFSSFYETFSKVYFSGVCIDFSNFNETLSGKYGGVDGYSTLNIYIRKCINSTAANKTDCFPENVIDQKLSQIFFNLVGIDNDIDSSNYGNPILQFYQNELLPLSSTIFKNYFKDINVVKFNSNNGYIFDTIDKFETYRSDKILESVDLRGKNTLFPGTFSQITYRCSGKTEIHYRNYIKIPATFAYIGGILQVILLIGQGLVYLYSKNSMLNYLFLHIFDFDEMKNELNKDKKIYSSVSLNQKANIKSLDYSHDNLKKRKNINFKRKGNQFKTINYISNHHLEGDNYNDINNENFSKLKNDSKNPKENEELKNIGLTHVNRKDSVNKRDIFSEINLEENFFSKISDKLDNNKKNISDIISENNIGNKNHIRKEHKILSEQKENRKINTSNQNLNIEDSSLNNINEINYKKISKQ